MYKVRNKENEPRKFREHKTGVMHFLRAGEEIIISNHPATNRTDVIEITELNLEEEPKSTKRNKLNKEENN